ncbi:MAG: ROK family protein [Bacteroidales bacterium]|jgi:glucokinase|nr:ROK family protein [Bacteroidales bacterium]
MCKYFTIGIDIGGTNTEFGLVNADGRIVSRHKIKTWDSQTAEEFIEVLTCNIRALLSEVKSPDSVIGVGIGAPNGNYISGTIEHAPNLPFKGIIELKKELEAKFQDISGLKILLTNDANAAAMGEMTYGKAKKDQVKDFIMITLGTGVGSGVVVDGKLVYGYSGFAGEIGHTMVGNSKRQCTCGKQGCLETFASASGIVTSAIGLMKNTDLQTPLRDVPTDQLTCEMIGNAAQQNDELALKCFDLAMKKLGFALSNACAITSPKTIYLFGGLTKVGDVMLTPLRQYLEDNLYVTIKGTVNVEFSGLNEGDAAILGASSLVLN